MRTPLSFFAVVLVFIVTGAFFFFSNEAHSETAPPWTLQDLNGKTVSLSDFKGQVVVLNFWATYCPPCLQEMPDFIAIDKEYRGKGVAVVGLSADSVQPSEVAAFASKKGMNFPIVMLTDKVAADYGADEIIPVTVIIGSNGKIAFKQLGIITKKALEQHIQKALSTVSAQ